MSRSRIADTSRAATRASGIALELAGQDVLVHVHIADAGHALEAAGRRRVEPHLHAPAAAIEQLADVGQRHQLALAHDGHAVADTLHLGEDVRREEDGATEPLAVLEDLVEGALHERVEALGGLVEDGQLGVALEGLDDADLLAHAPRVVADLATQVAPAQLHALDELVAQAARAGRRAPPGSAAARPRSWCRRRRCRRAGSRCADGSPRYR